MKLWALKPKVFMVSNSKRRGGILERVDCGLVVFGMVDLGRAFHDVAPQAARRCDTFVG